MSLRCPPSSEPDMRETDTSPDEKIVERGQRKQPSEDLSADICLVDESEQAEGELEDDTP